MNASQLARAAYNAADPAILHDPRSIEFTVIARVTNGLRAALESSIANENALVIAVHENRRLWTHIAASVAADENRLPAGLRASLFYLSEYVDQTSSRLLRKGSGLDTLIEVNERLLQGLSAQGVSK